MIPSSSTPGTRRLPSTRFEIHTNQWQRWHELIRSQKYHSLAARGEKVDVVLDKAERGETEEPLLKPAEPTALPNSDSAPAKAPDVTAGAQQHAPAQPSAAHLPIPQALVDCGKQALIALEKIKLTRPQRKMRV